MFDPLSSPFEASAASSTEQWGDDDTPNSPPPTTPRSVFPTSSASAAAASRAGSGGGFDDNDGAATPRSPLPPNPSGPPGREPQIYGEPSAGLISPSANGGGKFDKKGNYLRIRVTALDRNRRDIIIRMDAQTNLPTFTGTAYRGIARSYVEFQNFHSQLIYANPQTIIPALPLAQTSAPTDEEDDRIIKIMLQRWLTRICEDPVVLKDDELRSFVESEFGYQATPRPRKKSSTGFSLMRRAPPDEDEHLLQARFELTKLESLFFDAAKAVDKASRARKVIASAEVELGNKLISVATTETHPPLGNAMRKFGRVCHLAGDISQANSMTECTILGDSFGYLGLNAKSGKETLQQRSQVLEEYQAAVKYSISKRRNIERLKAGSNIRPDRVDEALEELEEANKYEQVLSRRVDGISNNLHRALQVHARQIDEDLLAALIEHARSALMYERQLLKELEALRPDFQVADKAYIAPPPTVPASGAKKAVPGAIVTPVSGPSGAGGTVPYQGGQNYDSAKTSPSGPSTFAQSQSQSQAQVQVQLPSTAPPGANNFVHGPTPSSPPPSGGAGVGYPANHSNGPPLPPLPVSPNPYMVGIRAPPSPAPGPGPGPGPAAGMPSGSNVDPLSNGVYPTHIAPSAASSGLPGLPGVPTGGGGRDPLGGAVPGFGPGPGGQFPAFRDGTQSMFVGGGVPPSPTPQQRGPGAGYSTQTLGRSYSSGPGPGPGPLGPLGPGGAGMDDGPQGQGYPHPQFGLQAGGYPGYNQQQQQMAGPGGVDPMTQSMRLPPSHTQTLSPRRNRLDAREAASKLANFL